VTQARPARRSPLTRAALWLVGSAVAFVVVVGALAAYRLVGVERDLRQARDLLERAGDALEEGRMQDARDGLGAAQNLLVRANGDLYQSTALDVVGWLPVARDNITALRESVGLALRLVIGGDRILDEAAPLEAADGELEVPLRDGGIPLSAVRDAALEARSLFTALPVPAERPDGELLVEPVSRLQEEVYDEALRRRAQLANLVNGLDLVSELAGADGPRRYLVAVANTAEMRGTGGMVLSYGVLESAEGEFTLPAFGGIDELFLEQAVPPSDLGVPPDELRRWEGLEITRLWRNVNVGPDFEAVAPRMAAMYRAATGQTVDGVIQIDAHGLAAILAGIGAVDVPGVGSVSAENAVALTLNEAYTRFPDRDQRQEVLGDVAEETFRRLVEGEYESLRPLGEALVAAAAERHVVVWSSRPAASGPLRFFDAAGELPDGVGDDFFLTVQNFGQDKLDYFLDTEVRLSGDRPVGEPTSLQVEVSVRNGAPRGVRVPEYVFGDGRIGAPGVYEGVASLYVPVGASVASASTSGGAGEPVLVGEGSRSAITWDVQIPAGGTATVRFDLELPPRPPGEYRLEVAPLPRVRPTVWEVRVDPGDGSVGRSGALVRREVLLPEPR